MIWEWFKKLSLGFSFKIQVCKLSSFGKEGKTKQLLQTESNVWIHLSIPGYKHCGWGGEKEE